MTTKMKESVPPTSFRLPEAVVEALDEGARRFTGGNRTKWLEFLALAGVSPTEKFIQTDEYEITIRAKKKGAKA